MVRLSVKSFVGLQTYHPAEEEIADWPNEASTVIVGTFTPTDRDPQSIMVFAEAVIEIEREFNPPLEVTEDNIQQVVLVRNQPNNMV